MSGIERSQSSTCQIFRAGNSYEGKQGLTYFHGISAERAGTQGICMHLVNVPPGKRANAHLHEEHETAVYVISGRGRLWFGDRLENVVDGGPGDMIYIPAGIPHLAANPFSDEPFVAVLARTDPNEQESVLLRPDLDALVPQFS